MKKTFSILALILSPAFIFMFLSITPSKDSNEVTVASNKLHVAGTAPSCAKLSYMAENLDDLISNTSLIIEAIPTENQKELTYLQTSFTKTNIKVKQVFKGTLDEKEITLLQTNMADDPLVKKGGRVLLFLQKYDGPIANDVYVVKGLYQGNYDIDANGNLISKIDLKSHNPKLSKDLENNNTLESLKNKINAKSSGI